MLGIQNSFRKAIQTLVGVMSMPLTQLGYDSNVISDSKSDLFINNVEQFKNNPQIERLTEYLFNSGQKLRVKQNTNGILDGRYEVNVNFEGEIPEVAFVSFIF